MSDGKSLFAFPLHQSTKIFSHSTHARGGRQIEKIGTQWIYDDAQEQGAPFIKGAQGDIVAFTHELKYMDRGVLIPAELVALMPQ